MELEKVREQLSRHKAELKGMGLESIDVFGSVARGEARDDSDIDLLVSFNRPVGLIHFSKVQRRLAEILGQSVDLVTPAGLRQELREEILRECVHAG